MGGAGGNWKKIHEKIKTVWKMINKKIAKEDIIDHHDNLHSSKDSGLGSESCSITLDHYEHVTHNKIAEKNTEVPPTVSSISKLHYIQPSLLSSSQSLFTSPTPPAVSYPVSIIKSTSSSAE
eukprot:GFUD01007517.1.p1 GENE.GFUD01007517.1~~GFUD01007517.1.p1  ORF type:complete len:132 (+),score=34.11 GFUD01007517.1:33-398(+)